jgi:hypothetical protein
MLTYAHSAFAILSHVLFLEFELTQMIESNNEPILFMNKIILYYFPLYADLLHSVIIINQYYN